MTRTILGFAGLAVVLVAAPAVAHHSFAMFDQSKVLTMSGPVNHKGYHYPELHAGCTSCAACLMVCPDYCFEVFRYITPMETEVTT